MTSPASRLWLVATVIVLDQLTKAWVVAALAPRAPVELGPVLNLVYVRNYGIGFGLFGAGGPTQQWLLAAFAAVVAAGLLVLQAREPVRIYAVGLALIAGGALGNAICRVTRGSVVDFVDLHLAGYHWPAFNVADMAITFGAIFVLAYALPVREAIVRLRSIRWRR